MRIRNITGTDINGDGSPEAVTEAYDGGAHCCWTYWIVTLANAPKVLAQLPNISYLDFQKGAGGRYLARTNDAAYQYFDGLGHSQSPDPWMYLEFRADSVVNVNPRFWSEYQATIADCRKKLTPDRITRFRASDGQHLDLDNSETKFLVLKMALAYLYAGREAQGQATLARMWPPKDLARIRGAIRQARRRGILSHVRPSGG